MPSRPLAGAQSREYFPADGQTVKIRGRKGRSIFGIGTGAVWTLYRFYPRSGSPTTLIAATNGAAVDLRHDTTGSGTFAALTGGAGMAAGKRWRFVMWPALNKAFGVNGSNGLKSYDGAVLATVTVTSGAAVDGPYIALHKDRLFSCRTAFSDYLVDVSELLDPTIFTYQINVSEDQGGKITGLFSYGDVLIILKTSYNFAFAGDIRYSPQKVVISDKGCVAPDSADISDYGVIYLGADGVYLTQGQIGDAQDISGPLKGLFITSGSANSLYPAAVGKYYELRDQYWLTLDPNNPTATTYILHRVHLRTAAGQEQTALAWSQHTGAPMNCAACWDSEGDDRRMLIGDTSGNVWRVDNSALDGGAGYSVVMRTAPVAVGSRQEWGRISRLEAFYRGSVACSATLYYNGHSAADYTNAAL